MSVVGIYCTECGKLIGAKDEGSGEIEHHARWCGYDDIDKCYACYDELNPDSWWEDEDEQLTG